MKSAVLPASMVPVLGTRTNVAALRVAAMITCAGVMPAATMSAISTCGAHGVLPSVPTAIVTPAAESFARLRAWMPHVAATAGRSVAAAWIFCSSPSGMRPRSQL